MKYDTLYISVKRNVLPLGKSIGGTRTLTIEASDEQIRAAIRDLLKELDQKPESAALEATT